MSTGTVWLVGAGPGDPDLVTVRGLRLLEAADAIVHDRLVDPRLLALARPGALRIDVGKLGHGPGCDQDEIGRLLVRLARSGLDVVRLKGGDPFVFGRGGEELAVLREAGVPAEVVPGVTAGVAGPAAAGIPVTHRGVARSVVFVTGHELGAVTAGAAGHGAGPTAAPTAPATDWAAIARIDTVVVFMAGRTASRVAGELVSGGRDRSTPAAVVIDATLPAQRVIRTELGRLADEGAGGIPAGRPALLVIGEVVRVGDELASLAATGLGLGVGGAGLVMEAAEGPAGGSAAALAGAAR